MRDTKQTWFKQAKYGLFIHWGLYALLAGEYEGRRTHHIAEWIMRDLDIPVERYEQLAQQFNPTAFDPYELVRTAKERWGMRYLTFTAKHHDGFAMYHSQCSGYNVVDATPYGQDIVAQLADACQKYEMPLCLYYSQAQDWHHPDGYRAHSDNSHKDFDRYLTQKCLPQIRELLTNYGPVGMMWFDTPMGMTRAQSQQVFDLVKSLQPGCIVSGRIGNEIGQYLTTCDNAIPAAPYPGDWEVPATLNNTWGYSKFDHNWKSAPDIIRLMVKINSRGGNYLLNIGPTGEGEVPTPSRQILDQVGDFLQHNGDSIFATQMVPQYVYDKDNCYFTAKPYKLFIHLTSPMEELYLANIGNTIRSAVFLQSGQPVPYWQGEDCEGNHTWIFRLAGVPWPNPVDSVICVEMEQPHPIFQPLR